jgi:periplasmic divalent cation tolerance protein
VEPLLVITNLPGQDSARRVAEALIAGRLAACVNLLAPCASVYRWQGKIETAEEIPLLIKTLASHYGKVEAIIRQHHPYELPEIIAVPISAGLPEYLAWVAAETEQGIDS